METIATSVLPNQPTPQLRANKSATDAQLMQTAKDFESFYLFQTLELMEPEMKNEAFSGGFAEKMFRHTLNEQTAERITNSGGIGIADAIYNQLLKYQEASQ